MAAAEGLPILGDPLYGGVAADRLHLHAAALEFRHPRTGDPRAVRVAARFLRAGRPATARTPSSTGRSRRLSRGARRGGRAGAAGTGTGWATGSCWRARTPAAEEAVRSCWLRRRAHRASRGVYFKRLLRQVRKSSGQPRHRPNCSSGTCAPERFPVRENGVTFELSFAEGYSTGPVPGPARQPAAAAPRPRGRGFSAVRRRGDFRRPEVLNCFAYTCAFSVCAALGGARATSLDLSRKYLDWGRRNFELNGLDPAAHDFIYGDVFDWLKRLAKKARQLRRDRARSADLLPLAGARAISGAETDYGRLVSLALPLLRPAGRAAGVDQHGAAVGRVVHRAGPRRDRRGGAPHRSRSTTCPSRRTFRSRGRSLRYLKTIWLRLAKSSVSSMECVDGWQSILRPFTGDTPETAEPCRRCDPTVPSSRRICASRSAPRGRRRRCRGLPHALVRHVFHTASFRRCDRSRDPSPARTRSS